MSFALSQEFIEMTQGLRRIVIDCSMAGMGRGAGNTNTELVMQYMNRKYNSGYDIDVLLDLIDNYIDGFHNQSEWGYSIPYFLAGSYSAHVNNISYLSTKAGIASRDINYLLNRLGSSNRKRYDYGIDAGEWNVTSHKFGYKDTPVIEGYHADKRNAGGSVVTQIGRASCRERVSFAV